MPTKPNRGEKAAHADAANMKTGLTLPELEATLVAARTWGFTSDAKVRVRIGWRGQIQSIILTEKVEVRDVWDPTDLLADGPEEGLR